MLNRITRRNALKTSAALASGLCLGTSVRFSRAASPNGKLNVACIGVGGQGSGHCHAMQGQNLVAIADCDEKRAGKNLRRCPPISGSTTTASSSTRWAASWMPW